MRVLILNGPNLGRLGSREPDVYGAQNFVSLTKFCVDQAASHGYSAEVRQTNDEAELISWLYEAVDSRTPVILNPAAFTHYSYALRDACAQVSGSGLPLVEVHLTNPASREAFRHNSVISGVATGTIAGFGFHSYRLAISSLPVEPETDDRR
ncbi:type II 3-dehydroquinate dehydratase [Saxibacter everestensis]|uniref:3-dehydroquinate dehydratase n=1 Tax=Saxibacter everestensis TaxID=2909229 RepID=A0ABY8QXQ9_9MICO|nr:type II 3-dehydroquinate dehydratase [Brevibacteriaceae bacterium ZFBP1038]